MEDREILELYFERSENAVDETRKKYGAYCHKIAYGILGNREDAKECVNDTYMRAWSSIPPQKPISLLAFLGKITRNLSLNLCRKSGAQKRGSGQLDIVLHELSDCVDSRTAIENVIDEKHLTETIDVFLGTLSKEHRIIFIQRYWYLLSIKELAVLHGISESKLKSMLMRIRNKLKKHLESEGVAI